MATDTSLYRLLAWSSPGFPIGAYSYSHGLEAAVASGAICDRQSLEAWIVAIVIDGGGRIDSTLLRDAHRAASEDHAALGIVNQRGAAYRATAELALESAQQGAAFLAAWRAAWPHSLAIDFADRKGNEPCQAVVFGAAAADAGIALEDALLGYLQAFAGNLVSAGLRLGVIGQTDGQRIVAALEPAITAAAAAAVTRAADDTGSATFAADLASMAHETQYSRLFRS